MGFGVGRYDQHNPVDIGSDWLQLAVGIRSAKLAASCPLSHNDAEGIPLTPDYIVTGNQPFQIGSQVAAATRARYRLHRDLRAVMGYDKPVLLGPEFPTRQRILCGLVAPRGAFGALLLNFFHSPGLLPAQFTFTHAPIIGWQSWSVEAICYTARLI